MISYISPVKSQNGNGRNLAPGAARATAQYALGPYSQPREARLVMRGVCVLGPLLLAAIICAVHLYRAEVGEGTWGYAQHTVWADSVFITPTPVDR